MQIMIDPDARLVSRAQISALQGCQIESIDGSASKLERMGLRVPFLKWIVSHTIWKRQAQPIREELFRQLLSRPETSFAAWRGDDRFREIAQRVCVIAKDEMGWPSAQFVPWDPFRVVFWAYDDGLDVDEAMLEVEDAFKIRISVEEIREFFKGDLNAFVIEIWKRSR